MMTMMNEMSKWKTAIICAPGSLALLIFVLIIGVEWFKIGIFKDPKAIAEYHFGSEAMVGEGGEKYLSAESYARSILFDLLFAFCLLVLLSVAWLRRSMRLVLISYAALIIAVGVFLIKNKVL